MSQIDVIAMIHPGSVRECTAHMSYIKYAAIIIIVSVTLQEHGIQAHVRPGADGGDPGVTRSYQLVWTRVWGLRYHLPLLRCAPSVN